MVSSTHSSVTRGWRTGTAPAAVVTSSFSCSTVTDHEPAPVGVDLVGVRLDLGSDVSLQPCG